MCWHIFIAYALCLLNNIYKLQAQRASTTTIARQHVEITIFVVVVVVVVVAVVVVLDVVVLEVVLVVVVVVMFAFSVSN